MPVDTEKHNRNETILCLLGKAKYFILKKKFDIHMMAKILILCSPFSDSINF
jgi:hypothetical protein